MELNGEVADANELRQYGQQPLTPRPQRGELSGRRALQQPWIGRSWPANPEPESVFDGRICRMRPTQPAGYWIEYDAAAVNAMTASTPLATM